MGATDSPHHMTWEDAQGTRGSSQATFLFSGLQAFPHCLPRVCEKRKSRDFHQSGRSIFYLREGNDVQGLAGGGKGR